MPAASRRWTPWASGWSSDRAIQAGGRGTVQFDAARDFAAAWSAGSETVMHWLAAS